MKCPNCGKEIANESLFCEFCGAKVKKATKKWVPWVAGILACIVSFVVVASIIDKKDKESEPAKVTNSQSFQNSPTRENDVNSLEFFISEFENACYAHDYRGAKHAMSELFHYYNYADLTTQQQDRVVAANDHLRDWMETNGISK